MVKFNNFEESHEHKQYTINAVKIKSSDYVTTLPKTFTHHVHMATHVLIVTAYLRGCAYDYLLISILTRPHVMSDNVNNLYAVK